MLFALLAAVFYAVNIPFSKRLPEHILSTLMAAFLYLGAEIGIGALSCFRHEGKAGGGLFFFVNGERPTVFGIALSVMLAGTVFAVWDTVENGG